MDSHHTDTFHFNNRSPSEIQAFLVEREAYMREREGRGGRRRRRPGHEP